MNNSQSRKTALRGGHTFPSVSILEKYAPSYAYD